MRSACVQDLASISTVSNWQLSFATTLMKKLDLCTHTFSNLFPSN
uniref:Uncharacterized protein n=1 Tax=Arundo donax TaxID=35708 RepID=A0A0A9BJG5_ARUDO